MNLFNVDQLGDLRSAHNSAPTVIATIFDIEAPAVCSRGFPASATTVNVYGDTSTREARIAYANSRETAERDVENASLVVNIGEKLSTEKGEDCCISFRKLYTRVYVAKNNLQTTKDGCYFKADIKTTLHTTRADRKHFNVRSLT